MLEFILWTKATIKKLFILPSFLPITSLPAPQQKEVWQLY